MGCDCHEERWAAKVKALTLALKEAASVGGTETEKLDLIGKSVLWLMERMNVSEYTEIDAWLRLQDLRRQFGEHSLESSEDTAND